MLHSLNIIDFPHFYNLPPSSQVATPATSAVSIVAPTVSSSSSQQHHAKHRQQSIGASTSKHSNQHVLSNADFKVVGNQKYNFHSNNNAYYTNTNNGSSNYSVAPVVSKTDSSKLKYHSSHPSKHGYNNNLTYHPSSHNHHNNHQSHAYQHGHQYHDDHHHHHHHHHHTHHTNLKDIRWPSVGALIEADQSTPQQQQQQQQHQHQVQTQRQRYQQQPQVHGKESSGAGGASSRHCSTNTVGHRSRCNSKAYFK
jgi:hypothetical protein